MTENNVAAQAGDEPMRAAFIAAFPRAVWSEENQSFNEQMYNYAFVGFKTAQVSPRATADVERDAARWQFFKEHAQDVYAGKRVCEWIGFSGVMEHGSRDAAIDFLAAIATTKPGA